MAVEIEAKMKVDSHDAVRERLKTLGAETLGQTLERNVFFDTDDRNLMAADRGLRIRRNLNVATGAQSIIITHKGPRQPGALKSREETEAEVTNLDDGVKLLLSLGFQQTLSFEKKRESWKLGKCKIELDELPHLGCYVEIEGPSEASVMKLRQQLELSDEPIVKTSYAALLMTWLQDQGSHKRSVDFAKA